MTADPPRPGDPTTALPRDLAEAETELSPHDAPPANSAGASLPLTLAPGEIVANRFRVHRLLGRGGMGEVFEAEDLLLREPVAVKAVHRGFAAVDQGQERFRREIQLARKVTHPNVCRLLDVVRHVVPGEAGSAEEVLLVAMELLDGETLGERLARDGRMAVPQTLAIALQVAAGLEAAHRAGVVHRDLKPGNVMLVAQPDGELRAVITDFGLARSSGGTAADDRLTGSGHVLGTPAYMAPEQVRGEEATARTDVYAFGVLLYEMLAGALPYEAETPVAAAVKRLTEPPTPLRRHLPELDPRWERVILRCLERDPAARFASAADVARELGRASRPPSRVARLARTARPALLIAVGVLAIVATWRGTQLVDDPPPANPPPPRRPVVLLLELADQCPAEHAWIAAVPHLFAGAYLQAGAETRVVGPIRREEQPPLSTPLLDRASLTGLRRRWPSDVVVFGTCAPAANGTDVVVALQIQQARNGKVLASLQEELPADKAAELGHRFGVRTRSALGLGALGRQQRQHLAAALPSFPDSLASYAAGLVFAHRRDWAAARKQFEAAIAAEPPYAYAHRELANALSKLGYIAKSRIEWKSALDLAAGLPPVARLTLAVKHAEVAGPDGRAIELQRQVAAAEPDDPHQLIYLSQLYAAAEKWREALACLSPLRVPPRALDSMEILRAEAAAMSFTADLARGRGLIDKAFLICERRGDRVAASHLRMSQGRYSKGAAEYERAVSQFRDAARRMHDIRETQHLSRTLWLLGWTFYNQGRFDEAETGFAEALAVARAREEIFTQAQIMMNIVFLVRELERPPRFRLPLAEEALTLARVSGEERLLASALDELSYIHNALGNTDAERRLDQEAADIRVNQSNWRDLWNTLLRSAKTAEERKSFAQALKSYDMAIDVARRRGDAAATAHALVLRAFQLHALGQEPGFQKDIDEVFRLLPKMDVETRIQSASMAGAHSMNFLDLDRSRRMFAAALALRPATQMGRISIAATSLFAGRLELAAGNIEEAERLARRAVDAARAVDLHYVTVYATTDIGVVLRERGDLAGAQARLDEALGLGKRLNLPANPSHVVFELGRNHLRGGNPEAALARISASSGNDDYQSGGHNVACEANLELGRLAQARRELAVAIELEAWPGGDTSLESSILAARIGAAEGAAKRAPALQQLIAAAAKARAAGHKMLEWEAELALGTIELAAGDPSGRARLEKLERETRRRGYGLFAARAARAAVSRPPP